MSDELNDTVSRISGIAASVPYNFWMADAVDLPKQIAVVSAESVYP